jgi:putative transposase
MVVLGCGCFAVLPQPTLQGGFMDYRRVYVDGGCYFFTVALANREDDLLVQHIETLRAAFKYVKERHPFTIDAMVVLPDHLHCMQSDGH